MTDQREDRMTIRELIENWVVLRDSGDWERFREVWHDDGVMQATWTQGTADEFIAMSRKGFENGLNVHHFLGGCTIDVAGDRAIAQTKMTIAQRAPVHDVEVDVVCTGRFYDFFARRDAGARRRPAVAVPCRVPASRLPADPRRLRRQARHARPARARRRSVVRARQGVARRRGLAVLSKAG